MREFKDIQEIYGTLRHMQAILKRPTLINAMNNYSNDEFYLQNAMSEDAVYDMACSLLQLADLLAVDTTENVV